MFMELSHSEKKYYIYIKKRNERRKKSLNSDPNYNSFSNENMLLA